MFSEVAHGSLRSLYTYLIGLVDHLNRVPPEGLISYNPEGSTDLSGLRQAKFAVEVEVDNQERIESCLLRYVCEGGRGVDFFHTTKEAVARQQQYLWGHKLQFSTKKVTDERWTFHLESYVPVEFEYQPDGDGGEIKLRVMNHESLGVASYTYSPGEITPLYLDELAKYIMRKPSRFHALSGDVVAEDALVKLRQQVAERKVERADELGDDPETSKRPGKKGGLFKSLFRR